MEYCFKYEYIIGCRIAFFFYISGATIANMARLKEKLNSVYFLDKRCF